MTEVPLIELLRSVPKDAQIKYFKNGKRYDVGPLCHQAADEIERLLREVVNRNARALAGDQAVAVRDGLVDEIERLGEDAARYRKWRKEYAWSQDMRELTQTIINLSNAQTVKEVDAALDKSIKEETC